MYLKNALPATIDVQIYLAVTNYSRILKHYFSILIKYLQIINGKNKMKWSLIGVSSDGFIENIKSLSKNSKEQNDAAMSV